MKSLSASNGLCLIKNAQVYAPQPLGLKHLLLGGGKILDILDEVPDISGISLDVLDAQGRLLMPGFLDAHAHITGGGGEDGFATQVPPVGLTQFTHYGVTTVVGLLGTDDTTRTTGNLLARVYALREEGMSAYCWTGGYHYPLTTLLGSAREDIVYVEPVIGVGEFAISDHRSSQPSFNEIIRIASEAHVAGLLSGKAGIVHFHLGDGSRKLELIQRALAETELPARVFNPTHVNRNKPLFEAACELLKQGVYIDITAFPEDALEEGWSAAQALLKIHERGLPLKQVTVSSDGGGCLPVFDAQGQMLSMGFGSAQTLIKTLRSAVQQGMPLADVLSSFTVNVAALLKWPHKGRIACGADADLLILDDDYTITEVMALGRWHLRAGKTIISGTFE